jgi:high-affinity Fe2+/Pb2+ permease
MASMVGATLVYRRPMIWGVVAAFVATALTWWVAQVIMTGFSRYGEKLEAVVSLIAIGVLLLITNWFFHKVYWKDWMASFHARKRELLGGAISGQALGFVLLGFTSVYREGFETVLFLQALVLESGIWVVLQGVALGMAGVLGIGYITMGRTGLASSGGDLCHWQLCAGGTCAKAAFGAASRAKSRFCYRGASQSWIIFERYSIMFACPRGRLCCG